MLPLQNLQALVAQYAPIPDVHERMTLLLDRARKQPGLAEHEKTDAARVPGCTSRVWLVGTQVAGRCHFRVEGDSALVRGLASLLCEVYEGATPHEVATSEVPLLEALGLAQQLSPTRLHGLGQVQRALQEFGRLQVAAAEVPA